MDDMFESDDEWLVPFDDEEYDFQVNFLSLILENEPNILDGNKSLYEILDSVVGHVNEQYGKSGVYQLFCAIENQTGMSIEIVGSREEIESALWREFSVFIPEAWVTARRSIMWEMMVRDVMNTTDKWKPLIVAEAAGMRPSFRTRIKFAWFALTKRR